jgi:ribosomal protein S18 acetylase RimI-like enzyme
MELSESLEGGTGVAIRLCTRSDILALRDDYATSDFAGEHFQLPPDAHADINFLVAFVAGDPVGHLHLKWTGNDDPAVRNRVPGVPELNNIGVWPPHLQSHGIGSALVVSAESVITRCGHNKVGLGVETKNARARRLYERLGYRDWGYGIYNERWTELDDLGNTSPRCEPCHYMVKNLDNTATNRSNAWESLDNNGLRRSITLTTVDANPMVADLLALAIGGDATKVSAIVESYRTNTDWLLLAANIDGRCVGAAGFTVTETQATLLHIATSPYQRSAGVGTALLDAVRSRLPSGCSLVAETDAEAVGFYRRNGFVVTSLGEKYPGIQRFTVRLDT